LERAEEVLSFLAKVFEAGRTREGSPLDSFKGVVKKV
jgi:hypothetical protein